MQPFKTKCILQDAGKVSAEIAKLHAETEFEKYRIIQDRLYATAIDYDKTSATTKRFYATVQNKMHFAGCRKGFC